MINIAVFVSGTGTNCENLIKYFSNSKEYRIVLVISNKKDAPALQKAQNLGVSTLYLPKADFNDETILLSILKQFSIDFIVLAGFLLIVPEFLINCYNQRMINIHPALLPKFGGIGMYGHHVHEAVKKAGETETGFTVHFVSNEVDGGQILAQAKTDILSTDSVDDIAAKEHELEMELFPKIVEDILTHLYR